jgi:hypothetical protein
MNNVHKFISLAVCAGLGVCESCRGKTLSKLVLILYTRNRLYLFLTEVLSQAALPCRVHSLRRLRDASNIPGTECQSG